MEQLKKIAFWTTGIILGLIILGSFTLAFKLISMKFPTPPDLITSSNPTEQEAKTKEIANYKDLTVAMQAQQTNIFDFVILKTLLPILSSILTIVLAYIFAKTALKFYDTYLLRKSGKVSNNT